ncbi:MAG: hypothetical protein ABEK50_06225 [bacterium]
MTGQEGLHITGDLQMNMDAAVIHDQSGANNSKNNGFLIFDNVSITDNNMDISLNTNNNEGVVLGVNQFDNVDIHTDNLCLDYVAFAECAREPAFSAHVENLTLDETELVVDQTNDGIVGIDGQMNVNIKRIELEDSDGYKSRSGGSWVFDRVTWDDGSGGPASFFSPIEIKAARNYQGIDGIRILAPDMSTFSNDLKVEMMRTSATPTCSSPCPSWEFEGMDPGGSWVELSGR